MTLEGSESCDMTGDDAPKIGDGKPMMNIANDGCGLDRLLTIFEYKF